MYYDIVPVKSALLSNLTNECPATESAVVVRFRYNYFLGELQNRNENKQPHWSYFDLRRKLVELKPNADGA